MGLFNDIGDFSEPCPECGQTLNFQTKDDTHDDLYLKNVSYRSVYEFHAWCGKCHVWVQYSLCEDDWHNRSLSDYKRKVIQESKQND